MRIQLVIFLLAMGPGPGAAAGSLDRAREAYSLRIYSSWREHLRSASAEIAAQVDPSVIAPATRLALADQLTTLGLYSAALSVASGVSEESLDPALVVEKERVRGRLATRLGRYPEGAGFLRRALERAVATHGEDARETALVRCDLGDVLRRSGKLRDAHHEATMAAAVLTDRHRRDGRHDEIEALLALGLAHHELGVLRKADELYRRALELVAEAGAEGTLQHARVLRELARLGVDRTAIDAAALPYLEWCLSAERMFVEILGSGHVETAETQAIRIHLFLAAFPTNRSVIQQAVDGLREVVSVYSATVGADHPDCLLTRLRLLTFVPDAEMWDRKEIVKRSFDALYEVMEVAQKIQDPPNPTMAWVYCLIGDFYHSVKNKKLMEKYWFKSVRQFEGMGTPTSYGSRLAATRYAGALMHRKRRKKALPFLIDVYQAVRLAHGEDHPSTQLARLRFLILLEERLHIANADQLLEKIPDPESAIRDGVDFERLALVFETPPVFAELAASSAGVTSSVTSSTAP